MKFLTDAHISVEMVAMLRGLGHDCFDSSAIAPRMLDVDVLRMAAADDRVLITSDKDFGETRFRLCDQLSRRRARSRRYGTGNRPRGACSVCMAQGDVTTAGIIRHNLNVGRPCPSTSLNRE